jgi:pyruvate, water dikinase
MSSESTVVWFDECGLEDVPRVGGKNASLGEMRRALGPLGVRVPDGFATTADAYRLFLRESGVDRLVAELLDPLDPTRLADLQEAGRRLRGAILAAELAPVLREEIAAAIDGSSRSTGPTATWRSGAAPPRRIYPRRASPVSRKPT